MNLPKLLLISGGDIPFPQAQVTIHNPTLKEIGLIGENNFFIGCNFLIFDKKLLSDEDKNHLENKSDFDIFMSVMNSKDKAIHKTGAMMVLALLFPQHKIKIEQNKILLQLENFSSSINEQNYDSFKLILKQMFCLETDESKDYNPADAFAAKIAEKLKKRNEKLGKVKLEDDKEITIYSNYISILSVGLRKDMNELSNYTVYQIREEFKRFQLKEEFDMYVRAKLAGAQDLEEVNNWMEEIHP